MIIFKLAIERALPQQSRNLMEKVNVSVSVSLERREERKKIAMILSRARRPYVTSRV